MNLTSEYLAAELAEAYEVLAYTGNDRIDFQFVLDRLARLITELGGEVPTEWFDGDLTAMLEWKPNG